MYRTQLEQEKRKINRYDVGSYSSVATLLFRLESIGGLPEAVIREAASASSSLVPFLSVCQFLYLKKFMTPNSKTTQ